MALGIVERVFRGVYTKPCWGATQGYGSMLMIEFGEPHLRIREPMESQSTSKRVRAHFARRGVYVWGDWRLTIFGSDWTLYSNGQPIAHASSTRPRIRKGMAILNGQALVKVSGNPVRGRWLFEFDLGAEMRTKRFDRTTEVWFLREPSGYTFAVRGDGRYRRSPSDTPIRDSKWRAFKVKEKKTK